MGPGSREIEGLATSRLDSGGRRTRRKGFPLWLDWKISPDGRLTSGAEESNQ
jgi:hypothetical protein